MTFFATLGFAPHLDNGIIVDQPAASAVLDGMVVEMDARYRLSYHNYKLATATARIK